MTVKSTFYATKLGAMALVFCALPVQAGEPGAGELEIPAGEMLESAVGGVYAFSIPTSVTTALAAAAVGDTVRVNGFPIAPGISAQVELERYEVYAPGARVLVIGAAGEREAPRSSRLQFLGSVVGDPLTRAGLSLDPTPTASRLHGVVDGPYGEFQIQGKPDAGYWLESTDEVLARGNLSLESGCGTDLLPLPSTLDDLLVRVPGSDTTTRGPLPTHVAIVAVDTDMELLDEKFGNDTAEATDWLADLYTAMNVAYERDVALRLLQGETFLRPGDPPYTGDPWNVTGSGANRPHLEEFGSFWSANMGGVDRVFAMLLSGKSSSGTSSSGIAWVDGYCETQNIGGGYSVTQVFTSNTPVTSDVRVIAHEIGHNAGSPHTHCYSPPVDECFNAQPGCYTGSVSCPPGGSGTLMSYCHFPTGAGGASCGANLIEFHPTVVALFDGFIASHTPSCVDLLDEGDEIFSDGFESGDIGAWS